MHQPIADVQASAIELTFHSKYHLAGTGDTGCIDWLVKLLNVSLMLGALELLVLVDQYKQKKDQPATDVLLQGYARVHVKKVLDKLLLAKTHPGTMMLVDAAPAEEEITLYIKTQVPVSLSLTLYLYLYVNSYRYDLSKACARAWTTSTSSSSISVLRIWISSSICVA